MTKLMLQGTDNRGKVTRRKIADVLGIVDTGASARGSTYYKTLLACPREFGLKYEVGIETSETAEALTVGWLYHHCLQLYYEAVKAVQDVIMANGPKDIAAMMATGFFYWGGANDGMKRAFEVVDLIEKEQGYADTATVLRTLLDGYFEQYHHQDKWRIVAIEETLEYYGGLEYTARLDLIIEDMDRGGMWIVEHKTARTITADLIDNYQMDMQILGQVWLLHMCIDPESYPNFQGVRVNIITKHKSPRFARVDVCPSNEHLGAFERSIGDWAVLKKKNADLGYPQSLGHCSGYARGYGKCTYFELCHGHPALSAEDWETTEPPYGYERKTA